MTLVVVAVCSAGLFLGLARAAVGAPEGPSRGATAWMAAVAAVVAVVSPLAGFALLGSVLLGRALAAEAVPATVPVRLDRYRPPSS